MTKSYHNKIKSRIKAAKESWQYREMFMKLEGKDFIEKQKMVWQWSKDKPDFNFSLFVALMEDVYKSEYYLD